MSRILKEWSPQKNDKYILYLDKELPHNKPYRNYRIGGVIYKPIPMSHTNGKCIAVQGEGNFVGKEVELVKEEQ